MKTQLLLTLTVFLFTWSASGQEIAIVTAPQASLLGNNNEVTDTVPFYHVLDVIGKEGPYITVRYNGKQRRVHSGTVHRTSQMSYVSRENVQVVRQVFEHLREASLASDNNENDRAVKLTEEALQIARQEFGEETPLGPWILQYAAWLKYVQADYAGAHQLLDICDAELEAIDRQQHFQAADVLNVRAVVLAAEGNTEQAIESYRQALDILKAELGEDHHDTAIVHENLSRAYEALEDYPQAIRAQLSATNAKQNILPEDDLNIALARDRLGDLYRGSGQHADAVKQLGLALEHYREHYPDRHIEIAELFTDIIYSMTENEDFAGADELCQELLGFLKDMPAADARHYRRDALLRMGTVDYRQQHYAAAMEHYEQAAALANPENYHSSDAVAVECIGDVQLKLEQTRQAKAAYEQAISIYAVTDGADSDAVLNLRDYTNDLDSFRDASLGGVIQVAMPQGYLLDDEGNIEAKIPGLTVLNWHSSNDEFHEVEYNGKLGRVNNTQLLRGRLLPAYGIAKAVDFEEIMHEVASSFTALENDDAKAATEHIDHALQLCEESLGSDNALYLWLKISEAGVQMRTRGIGVAQESLLELQEQVDALNPNAYPLKVDFLSAMAGTLRELGQNDAAVEQFSAAKDLAIERFGANHAVVLSLTQSLGKAMFRAGKPDKAAAELRRALEIADSIYPTGSEESTALISDISIVLVESGELDDAAELLEDVLNSDRELPRETHVLLVTTLGTVYARLGKEEDARKLLSTVVTVLTREGAEQEINSPSGLMALSELGKLDVQEKQWSQAADHLERALKVIRQLQGADSFEASTLHQNLATAYAGLDDRENAVASLNEVLRIYKVLGGGESPQANEIRSQLQNMAAGTDTPNQQAEGPPTYLLDLFNLTPDDEQMLVTRRECSVLTSTDADTSKELATLEADSQVWSLRIENDFHRIYVPDEQQFGWVHSDDVTPHRPKIAEQGEETLREELSDKPPAVLEECLNAFAEGRAEGLLENPQTAIAVLEESLATIESHYKYSNALSGLLYEDLLQLYRATGQKEKLNTAAEKSLTHFLDGHGYRHPATAEVRMLRAAHYREMGDLSKEARELEEVIDMCERRFGPTDPRTAAHLLGFAANKVRNGFFEEAANRYNEVLENHQRDENDAIFLRATARLGLGGEKALRKDYTAAIRLLDSAAEDFTSLNVPIPALLGQTLVILAWSKAQDDAAEDALALLDQAQALPLDPADAPLKLSMLSTQARIAAEANSSDAGDLATKAIEFSSEAFGPNHFFGHDAHQARGLALLRTDRDHATQAFDTARRLANDYIGEHVMFQRPERQISFLSADQHELNEALNLAFIDGGEVAAKPAVEWLINGHRLLPEILAKRRQVFAALRSKRDQDNFILWSGLRRARADVPLKFQVSDAPPEIQKLPSEQREEEAYFSQLPEDVQQMLSEKRSWITGDEIRRRMRPNEVLIVLRRMPLLDAVADSLPTTSHALGAQVYAALIIPATGEIQPVLLGKADALDETIDETLNVIRNNAFNSGFEEIAENDKLKEQQKLTELSQHLWHPMAGKVPEGTKFLTLCPDGDLHRVPWAALSDPAGNALIESFTIRHVSSPRDMITESPTLEMSEPVMMFRAVLLDRDPDLAAYPRDRMEVLSRQSDGVGLPLTKKEYKDRVEIDSILPQGMDEAEAVSNVIGRAFGADPVIYRSSSASEFRYFSTTRPRALHIAASGFAADPQQVERNDDFTLSEAHTLIPAGDTSACNPLVNSGLLMAGFSRNDTKHHLEDGILTAEEIASHDLRGTELVTLTVCTTQLGEFDLETAHHVNITHAFQLAGARSVVSSLWRQDEELRTPFIEAFYTNIADGMDKAEALRTAQLKIKQSGDGQTEWVSAGLWAGFRITGDGWNVPDRPNTPQAAALSQPEGENDPRKLAEHVLTVYKAKDIRGLLTLSSESPPPEDSLKEFAPGTPNHDGLFGEDSWRWQAVSDWDGKLGDVYYTKNREPTSAENADMVHVEFGRNGSEVFVVTFQRTDNQWVFDDLHSPDASDLGAE